MLVDGSRVHDASTSVNGSGRLPYADRNDAHPDQSATAAARSPGACSSAADAEQLAKVFKALGDPTRVRLLSIIGAHADGEACVCDLTEPVDLSQPTVSHHLKLLVEAGLVTREQRGRWAYYRLVQPALDAAADSLRQTSCGSAEATGDVVLGALLGRVGEDLWSGPPRPGGRARRRPPR